LKNYRVLEHTADIGIKVSALTLKGLFIKAWLAIIEISAEKQKLIQPQKHKFVITQKANNLEELMVNWLNELLSMSAALGVVFHDVKIKQINSQFVDAEAIGTDISNYNINTEIKAATYHQLKVYKSGFLWHAQVILDV
jgi:SHS2 domain-containing protein